MNHSIQARSQGGHSPQGRIQKFFKGGVLKFFCMDGGVLGYFSRKTLAN